MRVYILRFGASGPLTRAFDWVLESPDVASCMIESDHGRIRFLAPAGVADKLVERIYDDGGLVWCSRHDLVDEAMEDGAHATARMQDGPAGSLRRGRLGSR